jgi:esterase
MKLWSQIIGEGPDLIIMHGLFGMSDNWQGLAKKWGSDFRVHLLDMRNHGRSPHSNEFSYELMAEDLLQYLDDNRLERLTILGHSMGGKVAMLFSVFYPERVERLIVADIAPKAYKPHHQLVLEALGALDLNKVKSRKEATEAFGSQLEFGVQQFLLKNLYWETKEQLAWRFNLPVIAREIIKVGDSLAPNAFFDEPTLFLRGGDSGYIKDEDFDEIYEHFPQAEIKTVSGAGHWLHAQKPKEVYQLVKDFLLS